MALTIIVGLLILVLAAVPVAAVLGILSFVLDHISMGGSLTPALAEIYWDKSKEFILVAVPMFILLGEIMLRAGIAQRMYGAVIQWISWLPGGLMHANIGSCTIFAASSGSSVATAATVGTVAYPEIEARGYNERLFLGSLAAGGTIGILVPPSINLIIYGLLTDTSVPELYLAGIIPGIVLSSLFMLAIFVACIYRPAWGGTKVETTWAQRIKCLPDLLPPILLFMAVVGSIYGGIASVTEAAAVGVLGAIFVAWFRNSYSWNLLQVALAGTMSTVGTIIWLILGAVAFVGIYNLIGGADFMRSLFSGLGLPAIGIVFVMMGILVILGTFMEWIAIAFITVPVFAPVVVGMAPELGLEPEWAAVWFGVLFVMNIQIYFLSPPFGPACFWLKSVAPADITLQEIFVSVLPFIALQITGMLLVMFYPDIALWFPKWLGS